MTSELSSCATRVRDFIADPMCSKKQFATLALELFGLQFKHNTAYQKLCVARRATPSTVSDWTQIPAVPTGAFKEFELTSLAPAQRTQVFHSSGTTGQQPSRHFHNEESLALYEASLWPWFAANVLPEFQSQISDLEVSMVSTEPLLESGGLARLPSLHRMGRGIEGEGKSASDAAEKSRVTSSRLNSPHEFGSVAPLTPTLSPPEGERGKHRLLRAAGPFSAQPQTAKHPKFRLISLTPPAAAAPHSSLVHMFETVRRAMKAPASSFLGRVDLDGAWQIDLDQTLARMRRAAGENHPVLLLGTAFSFVHLLDFLAERELRLELPPGSRVLETGGYKGRARSLPKTELHQLITQLLGVPPLQIISEYGMSELSSQAYDTMLDATRDQVQPEPAPVWSSAFRRFGRTTALGRLKAELQTQLPDALEAVSSCAPREPRPATLAFRFPPWARVQIISPENNREVRDGETGLIRVFDLANVFSVLAIQTEDLAIRRGAGFELIGRAEFAEARGCSLMAV